MYAEPLEVWDMLDQTNNNSESFNNVSSGEELSLDEKFLIQEAFEHDSSKQDILIKTESGVASTSDYEVDLRDGNVTWNGSMGDLKIRYKTAPLPNSVCVSEIKSASQDIEDITGTTFDGLKQVTEIYSLQKRDQELILFNRPVREIVEVRHNKNAPGDEDDYEVLESGRPNDYYLSDRLSVKFLHSGNARPGADNLEITYKYGYENIPEQVNRMVRAEAAISLVDNHAMGEALDGTDDFNARLPRGFINRKDELLSRWTITRMGEQVPTKVQTQ